MRVLEVGTNWMFVAAIALIVLGGGLFVLLMIKMWDWESVTKMVLSVAGVFVLLVTGLVLGTKSDYGRYDLVGYAIEDAFGGTVVDRLGLSRYRLMKPDGDVVWCEVYEFDGQYRAECEGA